MDPQMYDSKNQDFQLKIEPITQCKLEVLIYSKLKHNESKHNVLKFSTRETSVQMIKQVSVSESLFLIFSSGDQCFFEFTIHQIYFGSETMLKTDQNYFEYISEERYRVFRLPN